MTVRELLARTTSADLTEQMAYDLLQRQLAQEAEQQCALNQAVEHGLRDIKQKVKR